MTDAPSIDDQINEAACIILGSEDWLERAREGKIKRPAETIERRWRRLAMQRAILATLKAVKASKFDEAAE